MAKRITTERNTMQTHFTRVIDGVPYNKHHPFHTKRAWTARQIPSMIRDSLLVPIPVEDHNNLHHEVKPPLVPSHKLGIRILAHVMENSELVALDRLDSIATHLGRLADIDIVLSEEAYDLQQNLLEQREFMGRAI